MTKSRGYICIIQKCIALQCHGKDSRGNLHCCDCKSWVPTTTTTKTPSISCFPSNARLLLENEKSVTMLELKVGDRVQTGEKINSPSPLAVLFYLNVIDSTSIDKLIQNKSSILENIVSLKHDADYISPLNYNFNKLIFSITGWHC